MKRYSTYPLMIISTVFVYLMSGMGTLITVHVIQESTATSITFKCRSAMWLTYLSTDINLMNWSNFVLSRKQYKQLPPVPRNTSKYAYGRIDMKSLGSIVSLLQVVSPFPPFQSLLPQNMEQANHVRNKIIIAYFQGKVLQMSCFSMCLMFWPIPSMFISFSMLKYFLC